ncbi:MAG: hypothetical protein ACI8ZB_003713 [Desulforhopalus sp.]|jgi:hypothetical protein
MAYLKDITVSLFREKHTTAKMRSKIMEFNRSSNCVSSMFLYELGRLETSPFKKIIIEVKSDPDYNSQDDMVDVVKIEAEIDIDKYLGYSEKKRKKHLLNLIYERLLWLFNQRGWDTTQMIRAYEQCLDKNINYVLSIGKKKSSPNRRYSAQLEVEYGMEAIIRVRISYSHSEKSNGFFELCRTEPHEVKFVPMLGKTKWTSKEEFTLWSKDNTKHWSIQITTN